MRRLAVLFWLVLSTAALALDPTEMLDDPALEAQARRTGYAVGVGVAIPTTVEGVSAWIADLESRGFELAPLDPSVMAAAQAKRSRDVAADQAGPARANGPT